MTDPARPQPVVDAAKVGGLVSGLVVAGGGLVLVVRDGINASNLLSIGSAVNVFIVALIALVAYVLPVLQGHKAAAKVTPLASPQTAQPLVPAYGKHAAMERLAAPVSDMQAGENPGSRTQAEPSPYYARLRANAPKDDAPVTEPIAPRYQLGRLPNDPSKPRVRLTALDAPVAAFNPPATVDWHSKVPTSTWGMDGNDRVGDCTCAEVDHCVKTLQVAAGNTEVTSTDAEVLALYTAVTGFNPNDPSTDQGAQMQDVRNYWRKNGVTLGGVKHTILLFAQVDHGDHNLIKWCIARFGEVGLGFDFPKSAMDQFNAGQPWTVVPSSPIEGGHAVGAVGYDAQFVYVTTWGTVQRMSWAFFDQYVQECWTQLSSEFVSSVSGDDPLGETLYQLGQQYAKVTGQPNPIPAPVGPSPAPAPAPTPAPQPVPTPGPVAVPADWITWAKHALTLQGQSHLTVKVAREILAAAGQ